MTIETKFNVGDTAYMHGTRAASDDPFYYREVIIHRVNIDTSKENDPISYNVADPRFPDDARLRVSEKQLFESPLAVYRDDLADINEKINEMVKERTMLLIKINELEKEEKK